MILTIKQGDTSYQLKAPVFNLRTLELGMTAAGSTVALLPLPEDTEEEPTAREDFLKQPENGYIVLGSTTTVVEQQASTDLIIKGEIPEILRQITTINGVSPNDNGEFFIDGSECDSWGYIKGGTAYPMLEVVGGSQDSGIWITDLCPACTSCETIYRLKYEVENLKMWLNTLKDVSLYWSQIYDGRTDFVAQRRKLLDSLRITGATKNAGCSETVTEDDRYEQLKGVQLLQQYMTVVHMWNYVVSRNNSSTLITIAPEDTTGFVVQTKRAFTSCDSIQGIRCVIDVKPLGIIKDEQSAPIPDGYPPDYLISVYVPDDSNKLLFSPFLQGEQQQQYALGNVDKLTISTLGDATGQAVAHKRADTSTSTQEDIYIDAKVAGTYVASVKFLPFIYYRTWRGYLADGTPNYISMRDGKQSPDVKPYPVGSDGTVVYNFGITDCKPYAVADPTEKNYLDAKTGPTCSVDFKILWDIAIRWEVLDKGNGTKSVDTENYRYVANGIRQYFKDATIMSNTTVLPVEPEEPDEAET